MNIFKMNNKGFSLVELIITLVLIVVLVSVGYLVISAGNDNFDKGTAKAHMQQNARLLDEFIQNNMRNATNVIVTSIDEYKLENELEIVAKTAISNGINITAAVIDDLQIRIDASGDRPVMEYIINTSYEGEVFELRSSIVLNNLPFDYFEGEYSDFTGIGTSVFTYNANISVAGEPMIFSKPNFIARGEYLEEEPVVFDIYLINVTFKDPIGETDIVLPNEFHDQLSLSEEGIQYINSTQVSISLIGNLETLNEMGILTIRDEGLEGTHLGGIEVSISIVDAVIDYIEINGDENIQIPDQGSVDSMFTFKAYDADDREFTNKKANWSLLDDSRVGVSISGNDSTTGVLTVTADAVPNTITVQAEYSDDVTIKDTFAVNLTTPQETLENLMGQAFLRYLSGYTSRSRPTFLTVDIIEGVTFFFSDASDNFQIQDEKVRIGGWEYEVNGHIKMVGHRDGEYLEKEFGIKVPLKGKNKNFTDPIVITSGGVISYTPPD